LTHSKPVGLWAVPRSVSTALERVFVERGDFKVFHEPFSASYYYSSERRSDRFAATQAKEEYGYEKILDRMLEFEEKPVYFKDMAYHVAGLMSREFISSFTNTFIIRDPVPVIASLGRFWPDSTLEETGSTCRSCSSPCPGSPGRWPAGRCGPGGTRRRRRAPASRASLWKTTRSCRQAWKVSTNAAFPTTVSFTKSGFGQPDKLGPPAGLGTPEGGAPGEDGREE
jgi:hypothetical protein